MEPKEYVYNSKELRRKRQFNEAEKLLEKAVEIYPDNIFLINNLILSYGKYGYDKAVELFNYAINNEIEDVVTCNIFLNILSQKNRKGEGEELFENIKTKFPNEDLSITYSTMLNFYVNLKDRESSENLFNEMEKLKLNSRITYNNLLKLYVKLGDYKKSESFFKETVHKGMANSFTYSTIIQIYYGTKEYEKGLELIQKTPYHFKDSIILTHEIEFNRRLRLYENCLVLIDKVLKYENLKPENRMTIRINQAFCYKSLNQISKAGEIFRDLYKTIRENDPSYIRVITGIIFCGDTRENEVVKFTSDLVRADRDKRGRNHAVIEAIKILSRMTEKNKINNIVRNNKEIKKPLNKNKN